MRHWAIVLGSAQDGGLPQLGAHHPQDIRAMNEEEEQRMGASLAVVAENGNCLLIDCSPDLRYQYFQVLMRNPFYAEARRKDPTMPIFQAIILTHAHMGHYLGLALLGKESANTDAIPTYVTKQMGEFLSTNAPWDQLVRLKNLSLIMEEPQEYSSASYISPWDGLNVKIFRVPHRAEYTDTVGVSINGNLMYIPDIDDWESWGDAQLAFREHSISVVDATFYDKEELRTIARDVNSIPHPSVIDTMNRFGELVPAHQIVFSHLNHSNPLCDSNSKEHGEVRAKGFDIAKEGQQWTV